MVGAFSHKLSGQFEANAASGFEIPFGVSNDSTKAGKPGLITYRQSPGRFFLPLPF
jgi:hypothetical protein